MFEEAWNREPSLHNLRGPATFELVGPKVQGNPYKLEEHEFYRHGAVELRDVPRDFYGLLQYFSRTKIEGVVWHHPDGRMVKIKRKDFGYTWPPNEEVDADRDAEYGLGSE
jgi:hypothetical protein